jgi:HEPN domain-containing protein
MKELKQEALRWFIQSENDLEFVRWLNKEKKFSDKGCFVAQQSAEKAMKACLYTQGERLVIGHSLFDFCEKIKTNISGFSEIINECRRLDRYYIPTRYPNGLPGGIPFQYFTEEDIRNALNDTEKVVNFCRKFLQKKGVLKDK